MFFLYTTFHLDIVNFCVALIKETEIEKDTIMNSVLSMLNSFTKIQEIYLIYFGEVDIFRIVDIELLATKHRKK